MMPYFQLPSLSFLRRRKNGSNLEVLFLHSGNGKERIVPEETVSENTASVNAAIPEGQNETVFQKREDVSEKSAFPIPTETVEYREQGSNIRNFPEQARQELTAVAGQMRQDELLPHSQQDSGTGKSSDAHLSAAIGVLTECARGQLRYLRKNYDLLKTQSEDRFFN